MNQNSDISVWTHLAQSSSKSAQRGDLHHATLQSNKALNEARRLLGQCWQKPQRARTTLSLLVQTTIACTDLDLRQGNADHAQERLISQMEQLARLIDNPRNPLMLRFQSARGIGVLLAEFHRRFCTCPNKNAGNVSRVWMVRSSVLEFWQVGGNAQSLMD